jgi:hypothetical protein
VSFRDEVGFAVRDSDLVDEDTFADITRDVLARIDGSLFRASASIDRFGNVGVEATQGRPLQMATGIQISSSEYVNISGAPQHAVQYFLIDGGRIEMIAESGSTIRYSLDIHSRVTGGRLSRFQSEGTVESQADGILSLTTSGRDIDTFLVDDFTVEIPLAFRRFDLGIIPVGATVALTYNLEFISLLPGFVEIAAWEFSDPGGLSVFGDLEFLPVVATPTPGTLALFLPGLAVLGLLLRRRQRQA